MSEKDSKFTKKTINGFNKGNGEGEEISASPGTNPWETAPGCSPSGSLAHSTDSTITDVARRAGWRNNVAYFLAKCQSNQAW